MMALTLLTGLLGIGTLAYINNFLLHARNDMASDALWQFGILVLLYLAASTLSQMMLARIGHGFIFDMQAQMLKQILDSPEIQLQITGKPKILASLSNDIRSMSIAFARLPELIQGILFVTACSIYLIWLSPKLFAVTALLMALMIFISNIMVRRHYRYFSLKRQAEDKLYQHYDTGLSGHKELSLNRYRAERFYQEDFLPEAGRKRDYHILADVYHVFAVNWGNTVMLAAVGIVFYLSAYLSWASLPEAATISMTILFMRGPLTSAIGALPTLLQSQVAVKALENLNLPAFQTSFHTNHPLPADWQTIRFENLTYSYPAQGGQIFSLEPTNLTLKRGETIFLIGANGSGKSTLSMLLSGLYTPASGKIYLDNTEITASNLSAYRQLFSSVFTDFHLFEQLVDGMGADASETLTRQWLEHLQLTEKAKIEQARILNTKLSQGQKKRLGLLAAALENRSILILDEWAADQDPQFRRTFYEHLLPLLKQQGRTIFAISHDDKYFRHADRILSMKQGKLTEHNAAEAAAIAEEHSRQTQ